MVTIEELDILLRANGWTPRISQSYKQRVAAAQKHIGGRVTTRYIATENRLKDMTEDEVLAKLARPSKGTPVEE